MRCLALLFLVLSACSSVRQKNEAVNLNARSLVRTEVSFEPLDQERAAGYLETERHVFKQNTDPMIRRREGLARGRDERYRQVREEFPECKLQKHCLQDVSHGDVQKFERFAALTKEIGQYDRELVELDAAIRDWQDRLELRTRAILNRFLVHELLQLPTIERHFQGVQVHALQSFETRRQLSAELLRYTGDEGLVPRVLGDLNFRMLSRPVDEAAVIATFDVYLMPPLNELDGSTTRYVVTMLVNTQQTDLRQYSQDFLRTWAERLADPKQLRLQDQASCGLYAIANDTLAPRFSLWRQQTCAAARAQMKALDAGRFQDRFPPERWVLPIGYYPF